MSSLKGKDRAKPEDDDPSSEEPSLLSRVAASATGLTRNAFTAPSANEVNTAVSNTEKGRALQTAGGGGIAWAESSKTSTQQQPNVQPSSSSGLKAGHSEQHAQISEKEFSNFLDGVDSFVPSKSFGDVPVTGARNEFDEAWTRSQALPQRLQTENTYRTVAEQEHRDGEDVMTLLSSPSALDIQLETPPPTEEDDNYDWGLTSSQISQLREITKDILPPPERHTGISSTNPMNLLPDFQGQEGAREQYLEEWDDVLNRYADEVWGGLLPLVKEARKEVEEMKEEGLGPEEVKTKAIRRLEAILGHLGQ